MTANGYPSTMAVRDADAVQPKDQQRKRFNGSGRNGQNGSFANGKEHKKDSHRRGGKDRHDRGGKGANKAGHKASKFPNPAGKPGAQVTAAGLDVQLDPKSLLGISGDLSMASTSTSTTDPSGHLRDICMAHVITSLADKTIGNPALMLQRLLDFSPADYDDLLLALAESGCSYVDILAAYIHNLRVVAADQPAQRAGSSASGPSADSLAGGITEKFNELLSEITKASSSTTAANSASSSGASSQGPTHSRRPSGGAGSKGSGRQQQQQQGNRTATPDRRRGNANGNNGSERRERGPRTASPASPVANGGPQQQPKVEQQHQQPAAAAAPAPRGANGRPPHPPVPPQHQQQQAPLPPQAPQHPIQQQHQPRQYAERPEPPQPQQHHQQLQQHHHQQPQHASVVELQQQSSGEQQPSHALVDHQHHQQQAAQQQQQQQHRQYVADMISPRTSAAPPAAPTPPAHLQQQQQLYLASLTATANAAMHDMHAGLLHPGIVADRVPALAPAASASSQAGAGSKLRTYWSENLEDASRSFPARADSLQPQPSHHLQSHHSSHHLQSHESYGHPQQQQQPHDAYGAAHHQFQPPQHLGGSLAHAPVPEEGPVPHAPQAEDSFPHPSSATAQYMAELQAAALHLMPMQQHQQQHQQHQPQQHQQQHQQHQPQVVLLPNGMPITLSPGGPSGSAGPDMSVLQLSGDPYGTAALGLSQMSSLLSVGSSHAVQLPSFHSEPLQWSTIWQ